jgi:DNA-binding Lrp family transcriptional regulator
VNALEHRLLNDFQRLFPLVPQPYAVLAEALGTDERAVIEAYARLRDAGALSRIGAVFRPGAIGASTLAAMAVPAARLEAVAAIVSAFPGVNHNYEREHRLNLWFVAAAPGEAALDALLARIGVLTGIEVLKLPLVEEYHIDLGFPLDQDRAPANRPGAALHTRAAPCEERAPDRRASPSPPAPSPQTRGEGEGGREHKPRRAALGAADRRLVAALEDGLALEPRPYAALAARVALTEREVIDRLERWQAEGLVRRFGVVVRHHELGWRANAMAVWDVPDDAVTAHGRRLAGAAGVTLAYRRARTLPGWPYNLFCMVHGTERGEVQARIQTLGRECGLEPFPHAVLFSRTRFKQTGPRYSAASAASEAIHG